MHEEVIALLLDHPVMESSGNPWKHSACGKARGEVLSRAERIERQVLSSHRDKGPAVAQRIRMLAQRMAQSSRWRLLALRFSRKARQNLAELEALVQFGCSRAVWEIAYLQRKQAVEKLSDVEAVELDILMLYHDCPDVLAISRLKVKERFGRLEESESRELALLQRNLYREGGIPQPVLDLFRPVPGALDLRTGTR